VSPCRGSQDYTHYPVLNTALGLGSTISSPVGSGAKPRPLLILMFLNLAVMRHRDAGASCEEPSKYRKKSFVHSVAVGLFHAWA